MMATTRYTRREYEWILSLQRVQTSMLKGKDSVLSELYSLCDNYNQLNLIKDLIIRFNCFDEDIYNLALIEIAKFISSLGYDPERTALIALCHDSSADSSQVVLNDLKVYINKEAGISTFINRFDKLLKYYNQGKRHFIAVDEFIGSGQTVANCYKEFCGLKLHDATLVFCITAGMKDAVVLSNTEGINIFVPYIMEKGISDHYLGNIRSIYIKEMEKLERNLADTICDTHLPDYSFGYKRSEALYSRMNKNVPNNVFPIFWWKEYKDNKNRITLFDRVQDGY
ncbi:hypothetical protein [Butyricimonas virosa]|uniref:phosphoribosyltransferase-like protein n=1 Tax=Butyricimonas virosa TaxID=544645 RepID=UPI00242CBE7B|nr:hypothetical protein [Butyricimonas virosa]